MVFSRLTLLMPRIAFLTMHSLVGFECDDELALEPLRRRGIEVALIPWREPTDWRQFDAMIVRSPWDYQSRLPEFLQVLRQIDRSGTPLWNPLPLLEWNLHKSYLLELQSRGVPIVPTIRAENLTVERLRLLPGELGTGEIVIKPIVGAGAQRTHRLRFPWTREAEEAAVADHMNSEYLAQPYLPAIAEEGEFSLIYFQGQLSHAILKTPKPGDFRSQEEFGSQLKEVTPDASLRSHGDRVLAALSITPLYGRVDLVRHRDEFLLMEVELVEPALYLSKSPGAAERFADALAGVLNKVAG
jgi:glutathione synthase/RimK-type ligase-like ATP-grasp enzyme